MSTHRTGSLNLALAAVLRTARERFPLTQQVAATRAGIAIATLQRAELTGRGTVRTIAALARLYGISVDDLRNRREQKPPSSPEGGAA